MPKPTNVVSLGHREQVGIAEGLRKMYQHIVDEGVPEHLARLVDKIPGERRSELSGLELAARYAPLQDD